MLKKLTAIGLALSACSPYSPEKMEQKTQAEESASLAAGELSAINGGQQICNPSMSQDSVSFPGGLLWLNFSGDLQVGSTPDDFEAQNAKQHDRLTISGPDNSVLWFMMMEEVPSIQCEFQDPEWSTHPEYLVTLGAWSEDDNCDESMTYGGYLVRTDDRKVLQWNNGTLNGVATPHVWVDPQAEAKSEDTLPEQKFYSNGFVQKDYLKAFLNTENVRMVWADKEAGLSLKYIDYTQAEPKVQSLAKPQNRTNWKAESPLISPDGQWVVYNLFESPIYYESWIQELRPGSVPKLIAEGAADPHWWVHPQDSSRWYVQYVVRPEGAGYIVKENLKDAEVISSESAGSTYKQELRLVANAPADIAVEFVGEAQKIVSLPMKGGRTPDGKYMGTGTNYAYILELN